MSSSIGQAATATPPRVVLISTYELGRQPFGWIAASRTCRDPRVVGDFHEAQLVYSWRHSDPQVDELCRRIQERVARGQKNGDTRWGIFESVWKLAHEMAGLAVPPIPEGKALIARAAVPYLTEPWYC